MLNRKSFDLILVIIFCMLAMGLTVFDATPKPIKTVLALPLIFVLPGYAVTAALFMRAEFDRAKTLLFSLALSIVLTIWCGFVLNLTLWGIQAGSWAAILGNVTLCAAVVALVRRGRSEPDPRPGLRLSLSDGALFSLAALATLLSLNAARIGSAQTGTTFTQFWMLPKDSQTIQIGVQNMERGSEQYKVDLMIGTERVYESGDINLGVGDKWEISLPVSKAWAANGTIDAMLYRLDDPSTVYRHTSIVLSGSGVSP